MCANNVQRCNAHSMNIFNPLCRSDVHYPPVMMNVPSTKIVPSTTSDSGHIERLSRQIPSENGALGISPRVTGQNHVPVARDGGGLEGADKAIGDDPTTLLPILSRSHVSRFSTALPRSPTSHDISNRIDLDGSNIRTSLFECLKLSEGCLSRTLPIGLPSVLSGLPLSSGASEPFSSMSHTFLTGSVPAPSSLSTDPIPASGSLMSQNNGGTSSIPNPTASNSASSTSQTTNISSAAMTTTPSTSRFPPPNTNGTSNRASGTSQDGTAVHETLPSQTSPVFTASRSSGTVAHVGESSFNMPTTTGGTTSAISTGSPHVQLVEIIVPVFSFLFFLFLAIYLYVKRCRRIQAAKHSSLLVLTRGDRRSTPTSYTSLTASVADAGDNTQGGDWRPEMSFAPSSPIPPARSSVRSPQSEYLRSYALTTPTLFPSLFMEESDLQHLVADSNSTTFKHEVMSRVSVTDDGHHIMGELENGERLPRASVNLDLSSDAPALIPFRKEEDRLSRVSSDISFPREKESAVGVAN